MNPRFKRTGSIYDCRPKEKKSNFLNIQIKLSDRQLSLGIIIGVLLSIATIALQSIAYSTAHWKEVSPNTHSLYIDSVDALIRTEILVYFNTIHRSTRYSYGLFHRCEYSLSNSSSKLLSKQENSFIGTSSVIRPMKICTKNFLPSYDDERFNDCHSLQYHRFCSQSNAKIFDINDDYLRATFDILPKSNAISDATSMCHCSYPQYVQWCQIIGAIALLFLCLTTILFAIFPLMIHHTQRVAIKCFGVLSSLLAITFIFINLLVVSSHFNYELIEYFSNVEQHYYSSHIYQLSQDVKYATERLLLSIDIKSGYSMKISWLALILAMIDGLLLMLTCKITGDYENISMIFSGISHESSGGNQRNVHEEHRTSISPSPSELNQFPESSLPIVPTIQITKSEQQTFLDSSSAKRSSSSRAHFADNEKL